MHNNMPSDAVLIVSNTNNHKDYYKLASKLKQSNVSLIITSWENLDLKSKTCHGTLVDESKVIPVMGDIPKSIWIQYAPLSLLEATKKLESIGCKNVNSSKDIVLASGQEVSDMLLVGFGYSNVTPTLPEVMQKGARYESWADETNPISCGNKSIILGRGDYALVSDPFGSYNITSKADVSNLLKTSKIKKSVAQVSILGNPVTFVFVMNKNASGWNLATKYAKVHTGARNADHASVLAFGTDATDIMNQMIDMAHSACLISEASTSANELKVNLTAGNNEVMASIEADTYVPEITGMEKEAEIMGVEKLPDTNEHMDMTNMSDTLLKNHNADNHRWLIEREMAHEGMWIQPDGSIAISMKEDIKKMPPEEAIKELRNIAIELHNKELELLDSKAPDKDYMRISIAGRRMRHLLRLLMAYMDLNKEVVTASGGIYGTSIAGPYANVDLPWSERVWEYKEGDDWLSDRNKAVADLPRYNPEYDKTSPNDSYGFYYVWDEPRRSPYYWSRILTDGVYPSNPALMKNPGGRGLR